MKKVLVTGGNKGIGKACCQMLLEKYPDVHVLLGSRDASRGSQAVQDIEKVVGQDKCQGRLDMVLVDTSSDESVATAAASVQGPLYGIINNAGIISGDLSQIVNVNYLGPRRVTDAFLSKVQRPGGRIVNVCSASGPMFVAACADKALVQKLSEPWTVQGGIAELDGIAKEPEKYAGDGASYGHYGFSKALLTAYTWILAKEQPDLIINSVTPGYVYFGHILFLRAKE